jgi:hypothetical protein
MVTKANNKSQNSQNLLHQVKSFFHVPLETLESAFLFRKLYNGCLEIIIWQNETNYLSKDEGHFHWPGSQSLDWKYYYYYDYVWRCTLELSRVLAWHKKEAFIVDVLAGSLMHMMIYSFDLQLATVSEWGCSCLYHSIYNLQLWASEVAPASGVDLILC